MALFRVWYYTENDRDEIARFKADDFDDVQDYLLKHFIKEDKQDDIEETEFGLMWDEYTQEECIKQHKADEVDGADDEDYNPCDMCDGCSAGFEIEEVENPTEDEFQFRTIQGTNDYYDLTIRKELEKKLAQLKEHHTWLESQWEKDVEFAGPAAPNKKLNACNAEIWRIEKLLKTEVEKAEDWDIELSSAWKMSPQIGVAALLLNKITLQEALSDELKKESEKKLKEAGLRK